MDQNNSTKKWVEEQYRLLNQERQKTAKRNEQHAALKDKAAKLKKKVDKTCKK